MLNEKHKESVELASAGANALAEGKSKEAFHFYARAAQLEEEALKAIPSDKTRTRSILSVSLAALLYKSQQFEKAEITIFRMLGTETLQEWANRQLRELLQVVSDERVLATELQSRYSEESITVSLRGGEIGTGTGPLDLILEKASGFRSLLYRFAELIGNYPIRRSGNPPKELVDLIQARATEPMPGSYQLKIRLTEPIQPGLFQPSPVQPRDLSNVMFQFFDHLMVGDPQGLEELVPQPDYRKALLQLTRNVIPRGKRIKEIGLHRTHDQKPESVYLTEALSPRISEVIPKTPKGAEDEELERCGVLRALHLDKNWLELTLPNGLHEKCYTLPDMLDDVVGPMVNRKVVVRGPKYRRGRGEGLLVQEIELVDED
jgi:hypothetical protein